MDDNEGKQRTANDRRGSRRVLTLFGIWLLFTSIVLAVGLPTVLASIRQSGVLTLLSSITETTKAKSQQQAKVWFFTSEGTIREFRQELVDWGGSSYHDSFESLLAGPKLSALKEGAVSFINPKTTLRGITLSNKVLYIDLSRHFMDSQDLGIAYEQLKRTGTAFSQVKDIVLLIEGERATLPDDL